MDEYSKKYHEENEDGVHLDAEIADIWTDALPTVKGDKGGGLLRHGDGGATASNDFVLESEPRGNRTRNSEQNDRNYKTDREELNEIVRKLKEGIIEMALTLTQKLLIYGLTLFHLDEETQETIFLLLDTEEEQLRMIAFLKANPSATRREILNEMGRIIELTM